MVVTLFLGLLAISSSAIFIRKSTLPSLSIAFWRVTLTLLLLTPIWMSSKRRHQLRQLSQVHYKQVWIAGICLGIHFWSWITSLTYTSVASSVLLVTTNPIWVGLLSPWLVGERLSRRTWFGIVLAMGGTAVVALGTDGSQQSAPLWGNSLALLGAFAASGYLLMGRNVRPYLDIWSYTFGTLLGAWCVLAVGMVFTGSAIWGFTKFNWLLLFCMACIPQLIGHTVMSWSLRHIRADTVALLLLFEPIGAAFLAGLFLQEWPEHTIWLGGSLLILGLLWIAWRPPTTQKNKKKTGFTDG